MDGNTFLVTHLSKTCADSNLERSIRLYNLDSFIQIAFFSFLSKQNDSFYLDWRPKSNHNETLCLDLGPNSDSFLLSSGST